MHILWKICLVCFMIFHGSCVVVLQIFYGNIRHINIQIYHSLCCLITQILNNLQHIRVLSCILLEKQPSLRYSESFYFVLWVANKYFVEFIKCLQCVLYWCQPVFRASYFTDSNLNSVCVI